jgi:AcrR family transcriptional regulator
MICQIGDIWDTSATIMRQHEHISDETAQSGRRARKALMTRRALLDAGLDAFERQPTALVSVLDITEAADVAKGVFYLHFASKDDFLIALADDVHERFITRMQAALSGESTAHALSQARLDLAVSQYALAARDIPSSVCFALRMASYKGDEIGQPGQLVQRRRAYIEQIAHALAGIAPEQTADDGLIALAQHMDALCWGVIWQALQLDEPPPSPQTLVEQIMPALVPWLDQLSS